MQLTKGGEGRAAAGTGNGPANRHFTSNAQGAQAYIVGAEAPAYNAGYVVDNKCPAVER